MAIVAAVAVAGLAPAAAAQDADALDAALGGFSDVTGAVHKPAIDALNALGVFDGTECAEGMFCPDSEFGLMGLNTAFAAHPEDGRLEVTGRHAYGPRVAGYTSYLDAREMLAWSRW